MQLHSVPYSQRLFWHTCPRSQGLSKNATFEYIKIWHKLIDLLADTYINQLIDLLADTYIYPLIDVVTY